MREEFDKEGKEGDVVEGVKEVHVGETEEGDEWSNGDICER